MSWLSAVWGASTIMVANRANSVLHKQAVSMVSHCNTQPSSPLQTLTQQIKSISFCVWWPDTNCSVSHFLCGNSLPSDFYSTLQTWCWDQEYFFTILLQFENFSKITKRPHVWEKFVLCNIYIHGGGTWPALCTFNQQVRNGTFCIFPSKSQILIVLILLPI